MNDLLIKDVTIVRPEGAFVGSVEVSDGKIARVLWDGDVPGEAKDVIDGRGKLLFPGMIDSHVHIRGGELSEREDFASGSAAAAAGGVTTFFEMPVGKPPACTRKDFLARKEEVEALTYVDFGLYGGAGDDNPDDILELAEAGAIAYKTFTMPPVPGREKEFYGLCAQSQEALDAVMETVAKTGLLSAVHSELNDYVGAETKRRMEAGENGLLSFCHSRPVIAETAAVERVIASAKKTGCRASVCHVSTPEAVELIRKAKADGVDVHGETCPQYILFNEESAAFAGVFARMKPPLRDPQRMITLRNLYEEGALEITGSDHAPYKKEEKLKNGQDIWDTFDGLVGLELSLRLLLNAVEYGSLSYEAIARNTAENTAKLFGIYPQKGRIEEGFDADLVLIARDAVPTPLDIETMFTKCRASAVLYDGLPMHYRVERTYVRGALVFRDGEVVGKQGHGMMVRPAR